MLNGLRMFTLLPAATVLAFIYCGSTYANAAPLSPASGFNSATLAQNTAIAEPVRGHFFRRNGFFMDRGFGGNPRFYGGPRLFRPRYNGYRSYQPYYGGRYDGYRSYNWRPRYDDRW